MELLPFVLATFSLLAIPGPTNTLLATSAAGIGLVRSLPLLAAELLGYLTAVAVLRLVLGPLLTDFPIANVLLRAAVTVYVFYLASLLWRYRVGELQATAPVTFRAVLLTTLLNPKAAIIAFLLLPAGIGFVELLPWIFAMAFQIVIAGAAWLALGAALGRGLRSVGHPELMYRLSAIALAVMATAISAQSLGTT